MYHKNTFTLITCMLHLQTPSRQAPPWVQMNMAAILHSCVGVGVGVGVVLMYGDQCHRPLVTLRNWSMVAGFMTTR